VKRALAIAVLVFVAVWPFVHRVLVAKYDINPWKLGGFAMYTTPTPPIQVVLFHKVGASLAPIDERELPRPVRRQADAFRTLRHARGRLRRPDALGAAVLEARPDLDWVVIAVQRMRLDRKTARMTSTREQFVYERSPEQHGL
jgi:hypothetical protein